MNILDRLIFALSKKSYLLVSDGPAKFGLLFKDGARCWVEGIRIDARSFAFNPLDIQMPLSASSTKLDRETALKIIEDELTKRGMVVVLNN